MKLTTKIFSALYVLVLLGGTILPFASAVTHAEATNLIANASVETADPANSSLPQGWLQDHWGTNTPSFTYANQGHAGSRSVTVQVSGYASGDAKWYFTPVAVQGGTQYTFSDYYKSGIASDVVAQFDDGSGDYTYQDLGPVSANANWTQYQATFTVPAGAKTVTVFHLIAQNGSLTIDDASLVAGSTTTTPPPAPNLTPNPSVETADPSNPNAPQNWYQGSWGNNHTTFSYAATGHTGSRSLRITTTNFTDGGANWSYDSQPVKAGKTYMFSDYYQSTAASQAMVAVKMSNGSTQYVWLANPYTSNGTWTRFFKTFTMPVGAVSAVAYHSIAGNGYLQTDDYDFEQYTPKGFDQPYVTITFDDSIKTQYTNAFPILQKYGFNATFYAISGLLNLCDPDVSSICYMSNQDVLDLYHAGNEIGSHTVDHPDLTTITSTELTQELANSQTALQTLIGAPVTDFAAPYGDVNLSVLNSVQQYYASQRGVQIGYNSIDNFNLHDLWVQDINSSTTVADIQSYIDYAKATNTWLILMYHDINTTDTTDPGYNTTPTDFDAHMAYLKASGVKVVTLAQGLQTLAPQAGN